MNATAIHVRWMIRFDMDQVFKIENETFGSWTNDDFLERLRQRNTIGIVAESGKAIVGFAIYQLHPKSIFVANLAALTAEARCRLIEKIKAKAVDHRRQTINWSPT